MKMQRYFDKVGIVRDERIVSDALLPVSEAKGRIKRFFEDNVEEKLFVLYYTGHGERRKGAWCFQNGYLEAREILPLFFTARGARNDTESKLLLITDSCHSGHWVAAVQTCLDREQRQRVAVQASCRDSEISYDTDLGGKFSMAFMEQSSDSIRQLPSDQNPTAFVGWKGNQSQAKIDLFNGGSISFFQK